MNTAASTDNPADTGQAQYPIRTVAAITGVNPVTLRAWERRYKLIKPLRTPKGHRLYSQTDIELISKLDLDMMTIETGEDLSPVRLDGQSTRCEGPITGPDRSGPP